MYVKCKTVSKEGPLHSNFTLSVLVSLYYSTPLLNISFQAYVGAVSLGSPCNEWNKRPLHMRMHMHAHAHAHVM